MPRLPRRSSGGETFHVVSQGIKKSYIFEKEEDIKRYISIMYHIKNEYKVNIIAYCVMNNHVHLLLKVNSVEDLSSYMHKLNAKYAQYFNKKYNRVGFVFRNRFNSENVYDEAYLYNCINYIFNNPVKAGICKNSEEYKFSNCKFFKERKDIIEYSLNYNYDFIDLYENSDEKCKYIIDLYLKDKKMKISEVVDKNSYLAELITVLYKHNISFRSMERSLGVGREKIRRCYNEKLNMPK